MLGFDSQRLSEDRFCISVPIQIDQKFAQGIKLSLIHI